MDYIQTAETGNNTVVFGARHFCLDDILDCGQCFRWEKLAPGVWRGIAFGRCRTITQEGGTLTFHGVTQAEFDELWYEYFDFGRDYQMVKERLETDEAMRRAIAFSPGMRVLRQEPWEALCSFILSQNNNIKRIRGLVERLCALFGEPVDGGYAFPAPQKLAPLDPDDLAPVRCGFRAKYILDAARRVCDGTVDLPALYEMEIPKACGTLEQISGVGPKVACCTLLYGFGRTQCVPIDVWIDRALRVYYPGGMPAGFSEIAGLGQQYLFQYVRNCPEALPNMNMISATP